MLQGYLTVNEVAEKWGLTPRRIRTMCMNGQIVGTLKLGHEWAILSDSERPTDGRVTTGEYINWRKNKN